MGALRQLLVPFSWLYGAIVRLRNAFYDAGVFTSERFGVPVVSVGNLTAGGTGKTPFVEYLVQYYMGKRKRVAVLSRGYKRASTGTVIVSDGKNILANPDQSGDEPYQIARRFPETPVISDERRTRSAKIAVEEFQADIIVLDDGFQHRAISRDLDIVLLRSWPPLDRMPMLPAGPRREPLSSLRRAALMGLSAYAATPMQSQDLKDYTPAPMIAIRFMPDCVVRVFGKERISAEDLTGKKVMGFCGIANPEGFERTLDDLDLEVVGFISFPDHHRFTSDDFQRIRNGFEKSGAAMILTTEKDSIRCANAQGEAILGALPVYFVRISTQVIEGEQRLHSMLDALIDEKRAG